MAINTFTAIIIVFIILLNISNVPNKKNIIHIKNALRFKKNVVIIKDVILFSDRIKIMTKLYRAGINSNNLFFILFDNARASPALPSRRGEGGGRVHALVRSFYFSLIPKVTFSSISLYLSCRTFLIFNLRKERYFWVPPPFFPSYSIVNVTSNGSLFCSLTTL